MVTDVLLPYVMTLVDESVCMAVSVAKAVMAVI